MDTRLLAVLLSAILLVLPTFSMGRVRAETHTCDSQNRLIGYASPTTVSGGASFRASKLEDP